MPSNNLSLTQKVRESSHFINKNSKYVRIHYDQIDDQASKILDDIRSKNYNLSIWKTHPFHPKVADEKALEWIFVCDSLNFCFRKFNDLNNNNKNSNENTNFIHFNDVKPYKVSYNNVTYSGYQAFTAALRKAVLMDVTIFDPHRLIRISKEMREILIRAFLDVNNEPIPLFNERLKILEENAKVLVSIFNGSFVNVIERASQDVNKLLDLIVNNFPSFRDDCIFLENNVYFLKRAQILVADIWACFEGESYGYFFNIDQLTAFADYRIPQILVHLGLMSYDQRLLNLLEENQPLKSGGVEEVEIRGNSILVVEILQKKMKQFSVDDAIGLNSVLLDFYLWDLAIHCKDILNTFPVHLCLTTNY